MELREVSVNPFSLEGPPKRLAVATALGINCFRSASARTYSAQGLSKPLLLDSLWIFLALTTIQKDTTHRKNCEPQDTRARTRRSPLITKSHLTRAEPAPKRLALSSSRTRAEPELSRSRAGPRPSPHLRVLGPCHNHVQKNDSPDHHKCALSPLSPTLHGPSLRQSGSL